MDEVIKVVKNVLSDKNKSIIYIDKISDEPNLFELQEKGCIQITKHERPSMGLQGYMEIVRGPKFREL